MSVYIPEGILQIRKYYGSSLFVYNQTILEKLEKHSDLLWAAVGDGNAVVVNEINNYHPGYIGYSWREIINSDFSKEDARLAVAKQYGYNSFNDVTNEPLESRFEHIIDTMLDGNLPSLDNLCSRSPGCMSEKSPFGHGATLLHYLSNNGVELYRQILPYNVKVLFGYLVKNGADLNALMNVYGGQHTFIELF